ncbi:VOC family protein [Cellulomonas sp. ES6]|uniref:VOC family protein n=1 Tax=Cellulomonas sp. ES6 TaxID=3039384 RepID=UPI0024B7DD9E|nr:VOC family protein [Cellulomonas sp. ES6]WHP18516.1 VOC family protein [Cellulomonas sp. ES6]
METSSPGSAQPTGPSAGAARPVVGPAAATARVDARHWRVLLLWLQAAFRTGDLATGAALVARVAAEAERLGARPDVTLRPDQVHVRTTTWSAHGLTETDLALADAVSRAADELGVAGDPGLLTSQEVAVDALDIPAVAPFWRAVLGYGTEPGTDPDDHVLADPAGLGPGYWFQQMDAPRPQRNRIHVDVTVPHDQAEARVAAALAAGGRLVSDSRAPAFWVLADPEGNEACVCTWQERGLG